MRPLPSVLLFTAIALLFACPFAAAQTLRLQPDGSLELLFTKPIATVTSLEQSTDLVGWSPAAAFDEVVSQDAKYETRRATVAIPSDVTNLFLRLRVANGWTVALSWALSSSPDVVGYCLYYGTASRNYTCNLAVGNRLQAIVPMPLNTKTCYFAVTAYTAIGLQSAPCPEVKVKLKTKRRGGKKNG